MKKKTLWLIAAGAVALIGLLAVLLSGRGTGSGTYDNLIVNGDFEEIGSNGLPASWYTDAYVSTVGYSDYSMDEGLSGDGARIVNHALNDARFAQRVSVSPNTLYRLHGYIKANAEGGRGANLSVEGVAVFSESLYSTDGSWTEVALYGRTGANQTEVTVFARLGGYSGEATGQAWFDDVTLCRVDSVPGGYVETQWYAMQAAPAESEQTTPSTANVPLVLAAVAFALIYLYAVQRMRRPSPLDGAQGEKTTVWLFAALAAVALALRVILALAVRGYDIDVNDFTGWANAMAAYGPSEFYISGGFSDYPPGYMLVLWLVGGIGSLSGGASIFLIKTPSMLCDLMIMYLLFSEGKKRLSPVAALSVSALYAFSPLALTAGAAWGQADSVMTLLLLLTVIYALRGQWKIALPVYVLAVLVKPQALMFGPLGLMALVMAFVDARKENSALQALMKDTLIGVGIALAAAAVVVLPFSVKQGGVGWLFELYGKTMTNYNFVSVNGCNLYFALGLNWVDAKSVASLRTALRVLFVLLAPFAVYFFIKSDKKAVRVGIAGALAALFVLLLPISFLDTLTGVGLFSYNTLGTVVIALSLALVGYLYVRGKSIKHLPLLGAVLLSLLFTLGTMMHERYLFPAAALLLLAYLIEKDKRILWLALAVTIAGFLNVGCVLDRNIRIGGAPGHLTAPLFGIDSDMSALEYLSSFLTIVSCGYGVFLSLLLCRENADVQVVETLAVRAEKAPQKALPPRDELAAIDADMARDVEEKVTSRRMSKRDYILMLALTAIYCVMALVNLGSTKAPQTYWVLTAEDEEVVFDLGESRTFEMLYYGGIHWSDSWTNTYYRFFIETSEDGVNWTHEGSDTPYPARMDDGDCFRWQYLTYASAHDGVYSYSTAPRPLTGRYVRLKYDTIGLTLFEVLFRDVETKVPYEVAAVTDTRDQYDAYALVDEQDTMTGDPSWFNGTYFDEIYHARTAYEHLHGLRVYETTHPPLGKVLMSFCIAIFGMTPFGWRFAGAMAGVFMLPAMYLIARRLFKRRWLAPVALLLLMFDAMHFTQTRIATIDSFVTLFIVWSVYYMFKWLTMDFFGEKLWKTFVPLALSGLFMGLAVASKWTGCYAGVGLALLFFYGVARRLHTYFNVHQLLSSLPKGKKNQKKPEFSARLMAAGDSGGMRVLWHVLSCFVFFIAVPAVIYYVSYIPYFAAQGGVTVSRIVAAAESMLDYHSKPGLGMNHDFYSPWYQWPLSIKPMWYYSTVFSPAGYGSSITAMGNPAVWWTGFVSLLGTLFVFVKRHVTRNGLTLKDQKNDSRPLLLLICFAAQYLPWMLVPRGTYIYHYFPSVPFIILCTALCLDLLPEKYEKAAQNTATAIVTAAVMLFIAFFPYLSGITVPTWWLDAMKWFPRWIYY